MRSAGRALTFVLAMLPSVAFAGTTFQVNVNPDATFSPANLTIRPGDTVQWVNKGGVHNVLADDGSFTSGPLDGTPWTFSRTFNTIGNNPYYCVAHGAPGGFGMAGTVNVAPGMAVADTLATDGNVGGTKATFYVTLAEASTATVTVDYTTLNGTATAPGDYTTTTGSLNFTPGTLLRTVDVPVVSDLALEGGETLSLVLTDAVNAVLTDSQGVATIRDDRSPKGDFNSDTRVDLLWRHEVSGQNVIWYMDAHRLLTGTLTTPATLPDTNWKMVGATDFNDDGKTDILWRHNVSGENVVWFMNGSALVSGTFTTPSALVDVNWKMVGTGDFNLDAKPDILWRHDTSGQNVVWFMNGTVLTSGTFTTPPALVDTNWKMVGTGDFDLDSNVDILWRHAVSGENVVWFMNGTVLTSGTFTTPSALVDTNWEMAATGDYDADGRVDVVWRHRVSGQNVLWFMNGTVLASGTFTDPPSLPDTNWRIVGPR